MFSQKAHQVRRSYSEGDRVYVKSKEEILESLGSDNKKDGCLFMEGMFSFCGQPQQIIKTVRHFFDEYRFRLYKTKATLYILKGSICDGTDESFDRQCDRSCYYLWHEDWLTDAPSSVPSRENANHAKILRTPTKGAISSVQEIPFCQLTNISDVARRNSWLNDILQIRTKVLRTLKRALRAQWNRMARKLSSPISAEYLKKDIPEPIREGDIVRVKSQGEILQLLDDRSTYKRLFFIHEMYEFCNKEYQVLKVIDSFYDEAKKKMARCKNTVMLEGVTCSGRQRLYMAACDRQCFFFWHRDWLDKVQSSKSP